MKLIKKALQGIPLLYLPRMLHLQTLYNDVNKGIRQGDFVLYPTESDLDFYKRNAKYLLTGDESTISSVKTGRGTQPLGLSGADPIGKFVVSLVGINPIAKGVGNFIGGKLILKATSKTAGKLMSRVGSAMIRHPGAEGKIVKAARPVLNASVLAVPKDLTIKGALMTAPFTKSVSWGSQFLINR